MEHGKGKARPKAEVLTLEAEVVLFFAEQDADDDSFATVMFRVLLDDKERSSS
jgi:hypothetical protein